MKLLGLNHLDIVVDDLKKSIEFYRKFGLSIEGTVDNGKTVFLFNEDKENPVRVELHEKKPGQVTGIDHIAFTVEDPMTSTNEIKFLGGVDFLFEPNENQQSGRTISNCYDPDGVQIQMAKQTSEGTFKNWE